MARSLDKEWNRLIKQEEKDLKKLERDTENQILSKIDEMKQGVLNKIPGKLIVTLNEGFYKAFELIFSKGNGVIEKTFRKEELTLDYTINDFRVSQRPNSKSLKQMEKGMKRGNKFNTCITAVEGIGLGVVGIGLPDIPLFLGILLKGIYETSASYGYIYKEEKEQILILKMITAALSESDKKREADIEVEKWISQMDDKNVVFNKDAEIHKASDALSQALLLSKFIQGFFVIGMAGGLMNPFIYRKVMNYVIQKYKKRYINEKRMSIKNERKSIL
ncbi:MAG: EcsC family protein [Anaerotignum sp.]|nr:EcsC family protein [Anaerotignum sp.]